MPAKKNGRPGRPVVSPDGTVYPSTLAASTATGIRQASIWQYAHQQWRGWRFADEAPRPSRAKSRKTGPSGLPRPVIGPDGVTYPSAVAAALAWEVANTTIGYHARRQCMGWRFAEVERVARRMPLHEDDRIFGPGGVSLRQVVQP